ncbi:MAG: AAA family ATPase [Nitrospirales bacterium]
MSTHAEIVDLGNGYAVHWPDQNIRILIEYLTKERNGIIGEITILDGASTLCESLRINLNAEPKTKSIAKKVHENDGRLTLPDWARMIESTCVLTLRRYRRGEPSHYIDRHTRVEPLTFAVNPLVPKKKACILFSDGGKGKSTFALALALAVKAGATIAGISTIQGRSLYLDWEDDLDVHARRVQAIQAGHTELIDAGVEYLRCTEPLYKQTYQLVKLIQEKAITFIVVDSLMAAMGGDASAEAVGHLFAAIRQFNVESLCIGHVPKTKGEGQEHATVYGSIFNQNYARAIWELQTEQEIGEDVAVLGLFHRKGNLSRKHAPIGLKVTHNAEGTVIRYEGFDLSKTAELLNALPLPNRIRNLLDSDGIPRSSKQIADELGIKQATVQATLSRHKGHKWSLIGENREAKWTTINP